MWQNHSHTKKELFVIKNGRSKNLKKKQLLYMQPRKEENIIN